MAATGIVILLLLAGCRTVPGPVDEREGWGFPADALEWGRELAGITDPSERDEQNTEFRMFDDGTWIIGRNSDSHGSPTGGTIVTRDSQGQIRAFFGHVCGQACLYHLLRDQNDLAAFYGKILGQGQFDEYAGRMFKKIQPVPARAAESRP